MADCTRASRFDEDAGADGTEPPELIHDLVGDGDAPLRPVAGTRLTPFAMNSDLAAERRVPRRAAAERGGSGDRECLAPGDDSIAQAALGVLRGRVGEAEKEVIAALRVPGTDEELSLGSAAVAFGLFVALRRVAERDRARKESAPAVEDLEPVGALGDTNYRSARAQSFSSKKAVTRRQASAAASGS